MAREYSNRRSSRQRGGAPHQFLVIIVTFLLGYLTASVFDMDTISHWLNTQVLAHHEEQKQPIKAQAQQAQLPPKPKFEFYTLLANDKTGGSTQPNVNAPPQQTASTSAPVTSTPTHSPSVKSNTANLQQKVPVKAERKPLDNVNTSKGSYAVQVAAFKARQDAEHMKGLLILKGFDVNVVPITKAQGNWFRVVVGPYSNRVLAQKAQLTLAKNERLKGMLISVGG